MWNQQLAGVPSAILRRRSNVRCTLEADPVLQLHTPAPWIHMVQEENQRHRCMEGGGAVVYIKCVGPSNSIVPPCCGKPWRAELKLKEAPFTAHRPSQSGLARPCEQKATHASNVGWARGLSGEPLRLRTSSPGCHGGICGVITQTRGARNRFWGRDGV